MGKISIFRLYLSFLRFYYCSSPYFILSTSVKTFICPWWQLVWIVWFAVSNGLRSVLLTGNTWRNEQNFSIHVVKSLMSIETMKLCTELILNILTNPFFTESIERIHLNWYFWNSSLDVAWTHSLNNTCQTSLRPYLVLLSHNCPPLFKTQIACVTNIREIWQKRGKRSFSQIILHQP